MTTRDQIDEAVNKFNASFDECRKKPQETRDSFDNLIIALRAGSWVTGVATVILAQLSISEIEGKRDEIIERIDGLIQTLDEVARGSMAPFTFVDYAAQWQSIGAISKDAWNEQFSDGKLSGYWDGVAAERYGVAMDRQSKALESVGSMCDAVAESLLTLSASGLGYYREIGDTVMAFVGALAAALAKIATIVEAPWGLSDAIDLAATIGQTVTDLVGSTAEAVRTQMVEQEKLQSIAAAQYGIPGNAWPPATAVEYNNATVTDGVNSWSVQFG